jgi:tetratricopeptide (TPR) repeat protein
MANRFCAGCGARLLRDASFCVECGDRQPGAAAPRVGVPLSLSRYAPLFVLLIVLAVGGGAVLYGSFNPKTPPAVPRRDAPPATAAAGSLPQGHPPLEIPEQVKQALREMAQKAAAAPDDVDAWKRLAEVQYRAGQIERRYLAEAAASYRHVLERQPDNLETIRSLGNIAFDQEQSDAAVGYYQRYLQLKPDDLNVQTDLATMYLAAGKTDQAIQAYEAVLKADGKFFQAQFNLAIAYRSLGDAEKTVTALEKARSIAPDDNARTQVEQLLARAKGPPPPAAPVAPAAAPAAPVPPGPVGDTFQADAEGVFRNNPVLAPKVQRVEWLGPESAKVYLREFPMDTMDEGMRTMFVDRMRGRIKEKKQAHNVSAAARFEIIDEATGKVMETISE